MHFDGTQSTWDVPDRSGRSSTRAHGRLIEIVGGTRRFASRVVLAGYLGHFDVVLAEDEALKRVVLAEYAQVSVHIHEYLRKRFCSDMNQKDALSQR